MSRLGPWSPEAKPASARVQAPVVPAARAGAHVLSRRANAQQRVCLGAILLPAILSTAGEASRPALDAGTKASDEAALASAVSAVSAESLRGDALKKVLRDREREAAAMRLRDGGARGRFVLTDSGLEFCECSPGQDCRCY